MGRCDDCLKTHTGDCGNHPPYPDLLRAVRESALGPPDPSCSSCIQKDERYDALVKQTSAQFTRMQARCERIESGLRKTQDALVGKADECKQMQARYEKQAELFEQENAELSRANERLEGENAKLLSLPRDPADCYRCERLLSRLNDVLRGASRKCGDNARLEGECRELASSAVEAAKQRDKYREEATIALECVELDIDTVGLIADLKAKMAEYADMVKRLDGQVMAQGKKLGEMRAQRDAYAESWQAHHKGCDERRAQLDAVREYAKTAEDHLRHGRTDEAEDILTAILDTQSESE